MEQNLNIETLEGEEWLEIKDYEGIYQVSNLGRVKNIRILKTGFSKNKIVKPYYTYNFLQVSLIKNNKITLIKVADLVIKAFFKQSNIDIKINYKDGNRFNNSVQNIELISSNQENEIWKDIPNFQGLYQASNFGRVKSLNRNHKILQPQLTGRSNYLQIELINKNKERESFRVQDLIIKTFIDNLPINARLEHKDKNILNNSISNLEIITIKNLPTEIWKFVYNSKNYQVSNLGRVKTLRYGERLLSLVNSKNGYFQAGIYINGKLNMIPVHRLVGFAFVPNPENKLEINHKNGVKTDNRVDNLEWVSHVENIQHAHRTGLIPKPPHSENAYSAKLRNKDVRKIRKLKETKHITNKELAGIFNVSSSTIDCIITRKTWTQLN